MFLILAFPPFDISGFAWVGLVPLLFVLEGHSPRKAFVLSFLHGFVCFTGIFSWIWGAPAFNLWNYAVLGVYLSLYIGIFGLGVRWTRIRTGLPLWFIAPPLWMSLEYARSHAGFLGAPWMLLGHSQYLHPVLTQITSITGVFGLSFLIVLTNTTIAEFLLAFFQKGESISPSNSGWLRVSFLSIGITVFLGTVTILYGYFILAKGIQGDRMPIALIQGNIPQDHKWDRTYLRATLQQYESLTVKAAQKNPRLIVWPETAVPGDVEHNTTLRAWVSQLAAETHSYLLVGSAESAKFQNKKFKGLQYNSMFLFSPDGRLAGIYRKIGLVPFGEYYPLAGIVKWPKAIVSARGLIVPGDSVTLFRAGSVRFGSTICWENIYPDLFRQFVGLGAQFMINATNEAWFGESAFPYQMLAMSTFRAVENRIAIARVANTGISAFIDPFGRIVRHLQTPEGKELNVEGILTGEVTLARERTFYTLYGDVFAWLVMAMFGFIFILGLLSYVNASFPAHQKHPKEVD